MRPSPINTNAGFTLVEVLVISPIIILFIGAFIALVVGLTGESLQVREKNTAIYDVQAALNTMEASVVQTTQFSTATTGVESPQGKNNSATQFTNTSGTDPDTLILTIPTTDRRPTDPARNLIYTGTGACNNKNPVYAYTSVFFVDTATKTLYKRTILPQIAACALPWQRASCNENDIAANGGICKARDEKLLDNVSDINLTYYSDATSTTPLLASQAASASSVSIEIIVSEQVGGKTVNYTNSLRATSLNAQTSEVNTTPPANPSIAYSRNAASPYTTTFTWNQVGNATGYNIRYRLGSGTWVNGPQNQAPNNTTYSIVGTARKQNADIEVTVVTNAGTYLYGTMNTTLPNWNDCTMPTNSWNNYGGSGSGGYNEAGFTKTTSGMVGLKGLVAGGTVGYSSPMTNYVCTLPVGFRPTSRQIFSVVAYEAAATNGRGFGRVDIDTDGNIQVVQGANNFVSLDGIIFPTASAGLTWTNLTMANGWYFSNYGINYGTPQYATDSYGRAWVQGLATAGTINTNINSAMPVSMRPAQSMHVAANSGSSGGGANILTDGTIPSRNNPGTYRSTQFLYYPGTTGWSNLTLQNSWTAYPGWTTPQCRRFADDIVIVKGLIYGGNVTYPAVITNLNSAGCGLQNSNSGSNIFSGIRYNGTYDASSSIDLDPSGNLLVTNVNASWTSLDSIHYIAD